MSAKFLQSDTKQYATFIKVNDALVRGSLTCDGLAQAKTIEIEGGTLTFSEDSTSAATIAASGKIELPPMAVYTQLTSETTVVPITGNQQQFSIRTFSTGGGATGATIAPAASAIFQFTHTGVVAVKTQVIVTMLGSTNGLSSTNCYCSATSNGQVTITRHNHGSAPAVGLQELGIRLIQSA